MRIRDRAAGNAAASPVIMSPAGRGDDFVVGGIVGGVVTAEGGRGVETGIRVVGAGVWILCETIENVVVPVTCRFTAVTFTIYSPSTNPEASMSNDQRLLLPDPD